MFNDKIKMKEGISAKTLDKMPIITLLLPVWSAIHFSILLESS
jgi:hypothetical protein